MTKPKVGIIIGSQSDIPIIEKTTSVLIDLGIDYELTVASAHRTPKQVERFEINFIKSGLSLLSLFSRSAKESGNAIQGLGLLHVVGYRPEAGPTYVSTDSDHKYQG